MKKGRISKKEDRFIRDNLESMSVEQMAEELDRNPNSLANYVKKNYNIGVTKEEEASFSLEDRPFYRELREQFTAGELELIKYHWGRIIAQFSSDVLSTEELQIIDVVKMEVLMNRCLKSNKDNIDSINRCERELDSLLVSANPEDMERALNLERQLGALRASQESLNRDYRDLQSKKSSMLREIKGTREQRIKRFEDSKESFSAWMANLMQNPEQLRELGLEMEMMRIAKEREKGRLSAYHKYDDGQVDQPFLNAETVLSE